MEVEAVDMTDDAAGRAAWKARLVAAVINRTFDDETTTELLFAALDEAHADGVRDAAYMVRKIGEPSTNSFFSDVMIKLSQNLLQLNMANSKFANVLASLEEAASRRKQ